MLWQAQIKEKKDQRNSSSEQKELIENKTAFGAQKNRPQRGNLQINKTEYTKHK